MSSEKLQSTQILCRDSLDLLRADMKTLLWLLSAVLSSQCVTSQISMVESGPGVVGPSETLDLTCKVTGASLTDSTNMYCVAWIRQPEGKGLEWLGYICYNNAKYYAQSVQGRMTHTRDTNKGEVYCKLTGVKPEESGTYYCARYSQCNRRTEDIMLSSSDEEQCRGPSQAEHVSEVSTNLLRLVPERDVDLIDNDILISLVHKRVPLWDTRVPQHLDNVTIWRL
ncbi:unnamed protein product [Ranitomeya imitator]|uniref:Ig-like domain-containing protein n=1 Tax=Ranitomeya imitator TaxID=111125 RepID=A0ABN9MP75_9NEOB|nr:unnamed protein product [Ranitomeya imitator]